MWTTARDPGRAEEQAFRAAIGPGRGATGRWPGLRRSTGVRALLVAACVAGLGLAAGSQAAPTVDGTECLPPGHPPIGAMRGLPPGHPPIAIVPGLPPGHPPIGAVPVHPPGHRPGGAALRLPPGHPPVREPPRLPPGHPPLQAPAPLPLFPPAQTVTI
jgi:hypothetical protein